MIASKFPFDRDFQIGILALCCQRYEFLLTAVEIIQPEYFEDDVLIWFFQRIKEYFDKEGERAPVDPYIKNELRKATRTRQIRSHQIQEYADVSNALLETVEAHNYVLEEIIRFCRRQAGKKVFLDAAPVMDKATDSDWDTIIEKVTEAARIGTNYSEIGSHWFATAGERDRRRRNDEERTSQGATGIGDVDALIGGGLRRKQLGIWMAATGGGKSIALPQVGRSVAALGYRVLHYTLELDEWEIGSRYDAAMTNIPIHELRESSDEFRKRMSDPQMGRFAGRLIIKEYPAGGASVNTLRAHAKQLDNMGWVPDLIIVDYGDLLRPLTNYENEYADLGATFRDLRGMASELNVPVWTATQVNRGGMNAETIDIEHISDSLKKAQIADVVLALCCTAEERKKGLMRVYLAKNRNGPAKISVRVFTAFDKMRLWDAAKGEAPGNDEDISNLPNVWKDAKEEAKNVKTTSVTPPAQTAVQAATQRRPTKSPN